MHTWICMWVHSAYWCRVSACDFDYVCELLTLYHCWWNVNICWYYKISRGYKQAIYRPLMFVFNFRSEDTHSACTISHYLRPLQLCLLGHWLPVKTSTDAVRVPKCTEAIQGFLVVGQNKHCFWPCISLTVTTSELEQGVLGIMREIVFRLNKMDNNVDQRLLSWTRPHYLAFVFGCLYCKTHRTIEWINWAKRDQSTWGKTT